MPTTPSIHYNPTSFTQGRMDFAWEELSDADRAQASADYAAGKGLIGGDPRLRPDSALLPAWGIDGPFFRTLALDDSRGDNGARLHAALAGGLPLEVEVGFGRGDFLLDRAARRPHRLFLGYETKSKATRLMVERIRRLELANLWVSDDDARFSLPRMAAAGRVEQVHILFPDPWWKEQHKVKRLFSPPFVDLLATLLAPGGLLHFKSDVAEYGDLVRYLVEHHPAFLPHNEALAAAIGDFALTHREAWCRRNAKPVTAFYFERRS